MKYKFRPYFYAATKVSAFECLILITAICYISSCWKLVHEVVFVDQYWWSFCRTLQDNMETDVEAYLRRRYENDIANIEIVEKEDLDLVSHTSPL